MKEKLCFIVFNNIKLPVNASVMEAFSVAKKRLKSLGMSTEDRKFFVYRRSIDARHRDKILLVYSIATEVRFDEKVPSNLSRYDGVVINQSTPEFTPGREKLYSRPVIVGSGPCGLFAALLLAENGYAPIIIERGGSVKERMNAVSKFEQTASLNPECNIQFGAGGAGTFSDGKLVTRINDPLSSYVIERFLEFGAPADIRYIAKPHIGTDVLSVIIDRIIDRIKQLGGDIYYNTKCTGFVESQGRISAIRTVDADIPSGTVLMAIGHSARDTYSMLIGNNLHLEAKPFSVGMRIEHLADDIDKALYGNLAGNTVLGRAEYNLSHNTKERGVYTFCMCPGGVVVPAASEESGLVVNGMSYHDRAGKNSNSAVVCSVFKDDYGSTPECAIDFQRRIERLAFKAGGEGYSAPIITVGDFLKGQCRKEPGRVLPTYMNNQRVHLADPSSYLPEFVTNAIKGALVNFDKKIYGFASEDAVLTGAETRTSAPIRILRSVDTRLAIGYDNLYPAGEGAGYAGGITSAAIDGIKSAIKIIERYKPILNGYAE